ncbi:UDP-N-acetylmuramoyl-tripeptide--D-alanyl-D-alanine ligase [uncultured Ilyobacter sp.]|uniref:UDP-N-acetylmuramoyl-tripeptide--D-alanyl-D- alanine ligase n=1 Tax=uncultured Ilyobacter sp. TaxID=544433 RepID=UPI002AA63689|nr:UDP-N-acetylmuramoyl-tripeptide--D-alanyl-D-alanine ligase [uncultured Ilyobacter sp.]
MKILDLLRDYFPEKKILESVDIENVCMDSREVKKGSLFFAIKGGNNHVEEAIKNDAALVVYDSKDLLIKDEKAILTEDTISFMQRLAKDYRKSNKTKVVAITGSNGKTTTKDMVYSVLSQRFRTKKTQGNHNNHIGLPYTILKAQPEDEILVLEMGMSGFGEIDLLCNIAFPDYGIITNIGESHLEYLKSKENVFKAKGELLKYVHSENTIIFGDDYYLKNIPGIKVGYGDENTFKISEFIENDKGAQFKLAGKSYQIPVNGEHNVINASFAVALGLKMGLSVSEIEKGLEEVELTPMRFQKIEKGKNLYINDAYNANPTSMKLAVETFDKLYNKKVCKIIVLGDMLELGEKSEEYHKNIKDYLVRTKADYIFLYGSEMKNLCSVCQEDKRVHYFEDKASISEKIESIKEKSVILLKGSRGMKLEEIIK